jgi:hypothetical protein
VSAMQDKEAEMRRSTKLPELCFDQRRSVTQNSPFLSSSSSLVSLGLLRSNTAKYKRPMAKMLMSMNASELFKTNIGVLSELKP